MCVHIENDCFIILFNILYMCVYIENDVFIILFNILPYVCIHRKCFSYFV